MAQPADIRPSRSPSGYANLLIGAVGDSSQSTRAPVWHSRGYVPHFDSPDVIQHVAFHLADSLPQQVVERLSSELRHMPPAEQDAERRRRVDAWLDGGHGCCVLGLAPVAELVQNALLHFDAVRYRLAAWVVMPNHVHVLIQTLARWPLAKVVASWKKFTARRINECASQLCRKVNGANQEIGVPGYPVWHREYWDRFVRNAKHFRSVVEYIHQNPVKAGLASRPQDWRWSSAATGDLSG